MRLKGKVCLITNCGEFMGPADATEFQKEGASLVLQSTNYERAKKNLIKEGFDLDREKIIVLEKDFGEIGVAEDGLRQVVEELGRIDVLLNNNPEIPLGKPFIEISYEEWRNIHLRLVDELFLTTKAALKHMIPRRKGKIVNVASASGIDPVEGESAYSSARGAAIVLTEALGKEMAKFNIQVNAIAQTATENPTYFPEEKLANRKLMDEIRRQIPLGRLAKGWEQAKLAAFLASDDSDFLCGSIIRFNGGAFV
jgi:2-keto-3-deoxy-L-fuconate dehydrogenase